MDNIKGKTVFIMLPDFTVLEGKLSGETCDVLTNEGCELQYCVNTIDGRLFYRTDDRIFEDEKLARAKKFIQKYKLKLRLGESIEDAWNSEEKEIIEMAVDTWPEELL